MKISDEERREVAQRLREVETLEYYGDKWCDEGDVLDALGLYNADDPSSCDPDKVAFLADLIEPQEHTDEVPVGEIPGGYIIRKPRKPLFDVMSSQNAFDVLPKVDNILKYISESVNYEVERKLFKSIAEAYGWKVMDE